MAEVAGSNPAEPIVLFANGVQILADDEHDEEEEFPNMFENSDDSDSNEEDPLSDIALRKAFLKSHLQIQNDLKAMGAPPLFIPPEVVLHSSNLQEVDRDASKQKDVQPTLHFSKEELERYVANRTENISPQSIDWIERSARDVWESTKGEISPTSMSALRTFVLNQYSSIHSHRKVIGLTKAFLRHIGTARRDPATYQSYGVWLELPRALKEKKSVTDRIVLQEDVRNVLAYIRNAEKAGKISSDRAQNYAAFVLFSAYTGQRSQATMAKLSIGQFRAALKLEKPVLLVESSQDKIKMVHWVPLAPRLLTALKPLLDGRNDDELMFRYSSFWMWAKRQKIPMSQFEGHWVLGDGRKFFEQVSDAVQLNESIRAHITTHNVSGVVYKHYRNPQKDVVYDVYMSSGWRDVDLTG